MGRGYRSVRDVSARNRREGQGDRRGFTEILQQVLGMLKYRGRKKELQEYIQKNEKYFSSVYAETYQALCSFLNMEKGILE